MIKFQTAKYNTELEKAMYFLEHYAIGVKTQPLKPYSIVEDDVSITLYKNNKKIAEFSKKDHAEAHTIEKLLMMIMSKHNANHNIEDRVYLCDRSYTVYDDTYKVKIKDASDISDKTYIDNDDDDLNTMILDDQPIKLLTDDVDIQSWFHKRLMKFDINDFNKMVKQHFNADFIEYIKNQYGFTPDNKFLYEFISEISLRNPLTKLRDFYQYVYDDIERYLSGDLDECIALYVANDLKSYYYITLIDFIYGHTFRCLWDELGIRGIMSLYSDEDDLQKLADYIQKLHFDRFDHNIAYEIARVVTSDPEKVANKYKCIQKRIYVE